jgi:hypothetical protein
MPYPTRDRSLGIDHDDWPSMGGIAGRWVAEIGNVLLNCSYVAL